MNLDAADAQRRRHFKADEARTDHDRAPRALGVPDDGAAVSERAQRMDMRLVGTGDRKPHRLGAGCQQQAIIGDAAAVGENHVARFGVDRGDVRSEPKVDIGIGVEIVRTQRQPVLRRAARQIILRQIWPIDRRSRIVAEHDDIAAKLLAPQHLGRGKARRAAADDHDPAGCIDRPFAARDRLFALSPDKDAVALAIYLPDRKRVKGRRARGLSGAQIEAGVMPGAANGFADHEPLGERSVVMAAMRVDGVDRSTPAGQHDLLIADVAKQGIAWEIGCNALSEIGSGWRGLRFCHGCSLRSLLANMTP